MQLKLSLQLRLTPEQVNELQVAREKVGEGFHGNPEGKVHDRSPDCCLCTRPGTVALGRTGSTCRCGRLLRVGASRARARGRVVAGRAAVVVELVLVVHVVEVELVLVVFVAVVA